MSKYLRLLWVVPACALLLPLFLILITAITYSAKFRLAHAVALDIFQLVFWITPAVGIVTLVSLLVLWAAGLAELKRPIASRAVLFACLDIAGPLMFIFLRIVLSGFTR